MSRHAIAPGGPNRVMVRQSSRRFLLWDGTDPVDSNALATGLRSLGFQNVVDTLPPTAPLPAQTDTAPLECFATRRSPRIWMPAPDLQPLAATA